MKLSIIILNYNVRYFLELCLKSVTLAIRDIDAEVIVVDNASSDTSCEMIAQLFPNVILVKNEENFGFSKGNNIGVSYAKGEFICILNPDTLVPEDIFKKLIAFSEPKLKLGAVGCKLINGIGAYLPESKRNVPYVSAAIKKLFGNSKTYYANHLDEEESGPVDVLVGAFMFVRKKTFNMVGGFDEDYFMYGEDIDISYKLLKFGYQNYYFGGVTILHFKGESTLRDKNYARRFYGAMQIFYKKHFKKNLLLDLLVRLGIKLVYIFRKGRVERIKYIYQYVLISNKKYENLQKALNKMTIVRPEMSNFQKETEIILDANYLSYKEIINIMYTHSLQKKWTYKILPHNSNFILGSDNTISRGEIISF